MGMEQICLVLPMQPGQHDDAPALMEMGLTDERELDELDAAARKHFEDPDTLVMPGLYFLAWARKPASVSHGRS